MRVLFDTNIVLGVLLNRSPWVADSYVAWQASDEGKTTGYIGAAALTDIFYIAHKLAGLEKRSTPFALAWRLSRFALLIVKHWNTRNNYLGTILKIIYRSLAHSSLTST